MLAPPFPGHSPKKCTCYTSTSWAQHCNVLVPRVSSLRFLFTRSCFLFRLRIRISGIRVCICLRAGHGQCIGFADCRWSAAGTCVRQEPQFLRHPQGSGGVSWSALHKCLLTPASHKHKHTSEVEATDQAVPPAVKTGNPWHLPKLGAEPSRTAWLMATQSTRETPGKVPGNAVHQRCARGSGDLGPVCHVPHLMRWAPSKPHALGMAK